MKCLIALSITLCSICTVQAQTVKAPATKTDSVYNTVDKLPEFPGGITAFQKYMMQTLRYPKSAADNKTQGRVNVGMVVERDGSVSNVTVRRGVSPELDAEAVRVISAMPKWAPGEQKGKKVRVAYTVPVVFTLKS